jgi:hypothetical protein
MPPAMFVTLSLSLMTSFVSWSDVQKSNCGPRNCVSATSDFRLSFGFEREGPLKGDYCIVLFLGCGGTESLGRLLPR